MDFFIFNTAVNKKWSRFINIIHITIINGSSSSNTEMTKRTQIAAANESVAANLSL